MTGFLTYSFNNINSKNTTLFLHGWGCNKNYMFPISKLKNSNSLIIDLPGFEKNKYLCKPYFIDDYIEDIIIFLNNFDHKITHIVAHSFGGKLAVKLANLLKVKGLILIAPSIYHKIRGPRYYLKVLTYKIIKHIKIFKKISNKMGSKDYRSLSPIMKKTMSNIINESVKDDIKKIKVPTILLFGDKDKITPVYLGKRIKRNISDSELIILKGNHFAYLYNKTQVVKIIESLVDSTC